MCGWLLKSNGTITVCIYEQFEHSASVFATSCLPFSLHWVIVSSSRPAVPPKFGRCLMPKVTVPQQAQIEEGTAKDCLLLRLPVPSCTRGPCGVLSPHGGISLVRGGSVWQISCLQPQLCSFCGQSSVNSYYLFWLCCHVEPAVLLLRDSGLSQKDSLLLWRGQECWDHC